MRRAAIRLLRPIYLFTLTVWVGGFTFHSGVVIPALHEHLGDPFQVGMITRQVTVTLNVIGAIAMFAGWALVAARGGGADRTPILGLRESRLAASSALLGLLFLLHRVMDQRLDTGHLDNFYAWHRAYLWASTIQWLVNLALLLGTARESPAPRTSEP